MLAQPLPNQPTFGVPSVNTIINKEKQEALYVEERRPDRIVRYLKGKFLGKGGFAKVYEFKEVGTGKIYAAKVVAKSSLAKQRSVQKLKTEISLHRSMEHKHIVKFERNFEDAQNVYILLEMCNHKSMMELIKKRRRLTEPECRYYLSQVIDAVKYMHDAKIIHRDLKLGNLFLKDMEVKIGDFGLATQLEHDGERKRTICGTPNYIAPEILSGANGHSYEVDVWAIGVILYTFLIGVPPFETSNVEATYKRIRANIYSFPDEIVVSDNAKHLIKAILHPIPESRPSLDAILEHRFFTAGYIPRSLPETALEVVPPIRSPLAEKTISVLSLQNSNERKRTTDTKDRDIPSPSTTIPKKLFKAAAENLDSLKDIRNRFTRMRVTEPQNENIEPNIQNRQSTVPTGPAIAYHPPSVTATMTPSMISASGIPSTMVNNIPSSFSSQSSSIPKSTSSSLLENASSEEEVDQEDKIALENMHKTLAESFSVSKRPVQYMRPERLSTPDSWIVKWVDYSNKYGLGYELADGTVGAYFNDSTKILLSPDQRTIEYIEYVSSSAGKKQERSTYSALLEKHQYPVHLQKKVVLLHYFKSYMAEHSTNKESEQTPRVSAPSPLVYVQKWLRTKHAIIFRLSNKTVQVNFFDHTKIMLSSEAQVVTYINKQRERTVQQLANIGEDPTSELVNRLKYTRDVLLYLISKNKKDAKPVNF